MKRIYLIIPVWFFILCNCNSQEIKYKIGIGSGIMLINSIKDTYEPNHLGGWLNMNSIDLGVEYSMPKSSIEASIGYMHNYNLDVTSIWGPDILTNYVSIKIGYKHKFLAKNFIGISTSNYIFAEKELEFFYQKRHYANFDIKYERQYSDKYSFSIVTPITYLPIGTVRGGLINTEFDYVIWAEVIGIQLYLTRTF